MTIQSQCRVTCGNFTLFRQLLESRYSSQTFEISTGASKSVNSKAMQWIKLWSRGRRRSRSCPVIVNRQRLSKCIDTFFLFNITSLGWSRIFFSRDVWTSPHEELENGNYIAYENNSYIKNQFPSTSSSCHQLSLQPRLSSGFLRAIDSTWSYRNVQQAWAAAFKKESKQGILICNAWNSENMSRLCPKSGPVVWPYWSQQWSNAGDLSLFSKLTNNP